MTRELAALAGQEEGAATRAWIENAFARAQSLHANFYEADSSSSEVTGGLQLCSELSERLYELFWPEGG